MIQSIRVIDFLHIGDVTLILPAVKTGCELRSCLRLNEGAQQLGIRRSGERERQGQLMSQSSSGHESICTHPPQWCLFYYFYQFENLNILM